MKFAPIQLSLGQNSDTHGPFIDVADDPPLRKRCEDCGRFVPKARWSRPVAPTFIVPICDACAIFYDDPAHY